ncbi:hypothetical protein [Pyrobaculum islandicum]|uniref:hypothetical protein n=1 Tax=Pyrobaculum islandicum TaxID=2277 RepID=UPI000A5AAC12|nr:hypothetical protein [Pyrobaculum islandicum]
MSWSKILTREGWAVIQRGFVATLWPPIPVPINKLATFTDKKVRAVINYVTLAKDTLMPPKLIIKANDRTYEVQLVEMYEAYGLVDGVPHLAMVNCWSEKCDLSPLYALAYPTGIKEVVYGYINAEVYERWKPLDRQPSPNALKILGDVKLTQCLVESRYMSIECGESVEDAIPLIAHFLPRI